MEAVKCRNCGHENTCAGETCAYCGSPLPRRRTVDSAAEPVPAQALDTSDDPFATRTSATVRLPSGRMITLEPGDRLMVGRGQDSPLAEVCTDNISREHAFIIVRTDGVYLHDNRSTNGTYLNGKRLEPEREYRVVGSSALTFASDPPLRIDVEVSEP